jgi:hypothetical protein
MEHWTVFDGWAGTKGVDPMQMPVDRFLNLVYFYATENAEEQDKIKFDMRLNMPDAKARQTGRAATEGSMWSKEKEEAALADFVGMLGGTA